MSDQVWIVDGRRMTVGIENYTKMCEMMLISETSKAKANKTLVGIFTQSILLVREYSDSLKFGENAAKACRESEEECRVDILNALKQMTSLWRACGGDTDECLQYRNAMSVVQRYDIGGGADDR